MGRRAHDVEAVGAQLIELAVQDVDRIRPGLDRRADRVVVEADLMPQRRDASEGVERELRYLASRFPAVIPGTGQHEVRRCDSGRVLQLREAKRVFDVVVDVVPENDRARGKGPSAGGLPDGEDLIGVADEVDEPLERAGAHRSAACELRALLIERGGFRGRRGSGDGRTDRSRRRRRATARPLGKQPALVPSQLPAHRDHATSLLISPAIPQDRLQRPPAFRRVGGRP
jgi:hypothetical protein